MSESDIPGDVRQFIAAHIDSVGQLEALLLLRSATHGWKAAELARRLYVGETETVEMLERMCRAGLLSVADGVYVYRLQEEALRQTVDELAQLYARQLIPITNLIHAKARRIRAFADAFRFRKDP